MSILVVSSRLTPARAAALEALVGPEGRPVLIGSGELAPRAVDRDVSAVLLDGDVGCPAWLQDEAAQRGVALVAVGAALFGVVLLAPTPPGEVVVSVDDGDHPVAQRLGTEFALTDAFTPLAVAPSASTGGATGLRTVLSVNHRFAARPALVVGRRGSGPFSVFGLGHADAALASPALGTVLRRALRRSLPAATGRPLGVGVLGHGRPGGMGTVHGVAATAVEGLAFVATCDRDAGRRKAAEHDFPGVRVHAGVEELAADDDVDVAVVATPPVSHHRDVTTLLRAGKHVVCEKPLCLTVAEADALVAEAAAAGRFLTVNQNRRWDADYLALRRVVAAGLLGSVFNMETFVGGFEHPCRAWHSEESVSGGMVYDWGSHHIDWIIQLFAAPPTTVSAVGHKRVWHDVTNLDQVRVRMGWPDGREAQFLCSDVAAVRPPKLFVQGTAGTLVGTYRLLASEGVDPVLGYQIDRPHHAEAPADLRLVRHETGVGLVDSAVPVPAGLPFGFHRNLADHLHLGDPAAVDIASVRDVVAVLEVSCRSAESGGAPVMVPAGPTNPACAG